MLPEALPNTLYEELGAGIRGDVYLPGDPNYSEYIKMFNGNVQTMAKAVVCPLDAHDVSKTILFCSKRSLSPSVKAGGYGTAGWAIGGDIVIDMSKINNISIEHPQHEIGKYTSLRDTDLWNDSAKETKSSGKRRRQEDADLRVYDSASRAVASFLRSPHDVPSPIVRRRLESDTTPSSEVPPAVSSAPAISETRQLSTGSQSSKASSSSEAGASSSGGVQSSFSADTSLSPSPPSATPSGFSGADPFGYLDDPKPGMPTINTAQSSFPPRDMFRPSPGAAGPSSQPYPSSLSFSSGSTSQVLLDHTQPTPIYAHAYVSFGAGKRQKEIDQYTASHPLEANGLAGRPGVIPYHMPSAAHPVGSSIMLLAGFGFLSRVHGLSIDNLVEVEIVLADGRILIANEKEHPDLFWALRGAGPAFGVATRYIAKAYPVPVVFAGNLIYGFNRSTAPSLIKHFRDCVKNAPRELYANVLLTAGPAGAASNIIVIQMCYIGDKERGREFLDAISSWEGEGCKFNEVHEKRFLSQQDSVAQLLRGEAGRQWFIRSALIHSLPDEIVNQTVMQFADAPRGCTWLFELAGGAIADCENTCLPKSQREAAFTIAALHQWEMDDDDARCIESAEEWINGTLASVAVGGPYPSFLGRHEAPSRVMASYGGDGPNWQRLVELKKKYDPMNIFRHNFWPLDKDERVVDPQTHEPSTLSRARS